MSETLKDQISRLEGMAAGDPTWDLSDNDQAAIRTLLDQRNELLEALNKLRGAIDGIGMEYPYLSECKAIALKAIAKSEGIWAI